MRRAAVLLAGCLCWTIAGCDDADPRLTAQIESLVGKKICFRPEDSRWSDYRACFPVVGIDVAELQPGVCVEARFPSRMARGTLTTPVTINQLLDRECK
ncbi:MAG: hypothetical protein ACRDV9_07285 [Acidimicrobiia bacterium]